MQPQIHHDGVAKFLHLLRYCEFNVTAAYLGRPHSNKFAFLAYEVFYLGLCKKQLGQLQS